MSYGSTMLENQQTSALIVAVINTVFSTISLFPVELLPRKKLLAICLGTIFVSQLLFQFTDLQIAAVTLLLLGF